MSTPPTRNDSGLDSDLETFRRQLSTAADLVVRLFATLNLARVTPSTTWREIFAMFDEPLPQHPQHMDDILRQVERDIYANSTLYLTPRFFGYINSGGNQASILAELLAAAVNQIPAMWHFSPAAHEVERRVIRWLAEFIGYPVDADGCLSTGGSAGNLMGLAMARHQKAGFDTAAMGMRDGPLATVYVSREGHASVDKAMALLGMGRNQLRRIDTRDDFTIDLNALTSRIARDRRAGCRPICIIGNAGTTNTGAVDPLGALAELCHSEDMWLHVDAAYGGPAAKTAAAGELFRGLDQADSVVVNPHKWLYVQAEASCILVRNPNALRHTFQIAADYLREDDWSSTAGPFDFKDYGLQLHRSFRALKVWMTFKAYGATKLRAAIESNIEIMRYLADRIDESEDFVRLAPVPLSVVCFAYRTHDAEVHEDRHCLDFLNSRLPQLLESDGRMFISGTKIRGQSVLRACSVNHRLQRQHVDDLLDVIRDVARPLVAQLRRTPQA